MDTINKKFSFALVPPVFKRGHQVMLAIFDREDRLYLARKHAYPIDIYRLFGGGVNENETSDQAASRELFEETGLNLPLSHKQTFSFEITETSSNKTFNYTADLYYATIQSTPITPGDDVNGMKIFLKTDLKDLMTLYQELSAEPVSPKNDEIFSWLDWGIVFGEMNAYVLSHWPQS